MTATKTRPVKATEGSTLPSLDEAVTEKATVAEAALEDLRRAQREALEAASRDRAAVEAQAQAAREVEAQHRQALAEVLAQEEAQRQEEERAVQRARLADMNTAVVDERNRLAAEFAEAHAATIAVAHRWARLQTDMAALRDTTVSVETFAHHTGAAGPGRGFEQQPIMIRLRRGDTVADNAVAQVLPGLNNIASVTPPPPVEAPAAGNAP